MMLPLQQEQATLGEACADQETEGQNPIPMTQQQKL